VWFQFNLTTSCNLIFVESFLGNKNFEFFLPLNTLMSTTNPESTNPEIQKSKNPKIQKSKNPKIQNPKMSIF